MMHPLPQQAEMCSAPLTCIKSFSPSELALPWFPSIYTPSFPERGTAGCLRKESWSAALGCVVGFFCRAKLVPRTVFPSGVVGVGPLGLSPSELAVQRTFTLSLRF